MFSYHIVQPRETLYLIALKYNIAPCLLLRLNKLRRAHDLRPGMRLLVPCYGGACTKDSFPLQIEDNNDEYFDYNARDCQIGNDIVNESVHETSMPEIPSGEYMIGEDIKFERYEVKPGDSVFQIAKKFNTTISNIIIANGLRPPYMIFPGQELIIPYAEDEIVLYTVKPGDTVYKIAMEYGVPIRNIIDYNYLDKLATIYPGQQLIVKLN